MNINGIVVLVSLFVILIIGIIGLAWIMQDDRKEIKKKEERSKNV